LRQPEQSKSIGRSTEAVCISTEHANDAHTTLLASCRRRIGVGSGRRGTIKIGILHSLSGTMAISETILKDLMLMQVAELNRTGGLLGKKVEPVVVDPASNWPLFAEKARELISKDKVAAVFGCWTSVSRKSVLPVFEELNGLLFYPLEYEGEEASYNIFYGSSVPDNKAIPAVEYLMSKDGGEVKRFILEGTDYAYPRTSNKIIRAYLTYKGVKDEDIMEKYTPFGFADWQTEVAAIKKFGSAGKKTAVISTINGNANVPFYKELANQGVKASDIPVIAFSVGEEELAGLDTKPLVGHLAAWSYFESVNTPENKAFIAKWHEYMHDISASPTTRCRPTSSSTCGRRRRSRPARPTSTPCARP
jgi:branched-chain amino acid transport system substrate-binding protein/urea transport system substrate-binding protein